MTYSERVAGLHEEEIEALARAGAWYASYFARPIADEAGETHAYAVEERRAYLALLRALDGLGVTIPVPDELQPHLRAA